MVFGLGPGMRQRDKAGRRRSVRCPFCNEDVQADASICRHCGNDLKIPESLALENAELMERVANLRRELADLHGRLGRQNRS
jgi:predicted amidophosphoribosyltransferase